MKHLILLFSTVLVIFGCSSNNNGTVTVVPLAPTNLTGSTISTTQINLSWTDNATNEDGYKIERKTGTGNYAVIGSTATNITTFSDLGLTPNTSYTYRVYAYNSAGNSVQYSNELTIATQESIPSWLTSGLVAYWPFNGNANDESGNGNNGTVNGATLTSDRFGITSKAYSFDGVTSYINCLNPGPNGNPTVSISFWLNSNNPGVSAQILGWGQSQQTSGGEFRILTQHRPTQCTNTIAFDTYNSANIFNTFYLGNWDHYTVIYDGTTGINVSIVKIYKNGLIIDSQCTIDNRYSTNIINQFPITFGKDHGGSFAFLNGSLDDIRIYNRALSASEVAYLAAH